MTDKFSGLTTFLGSKAGQTVTLVLTGGFLVLVAMGAIDLPWSKKGPEVDAFTAEKMRGLLRKEIAPLRAGIEELAKSQSLETQNLVLRAMMRAERKAEGEN